MKPDARTIVQDAGMSARPGFYSGRGAMVCDLSDRHLQKIYDAIKTHYGDDAAKNFVMMVADIRVLSATDFLLALYRLEGLEWKWPGPNTKDSNDGIYYDNEFELIATVAQVLGAAFGGTGERDETVSIRSNFLRTHKAELSEKQRDQIDGLGFSYDMRGHRVRW
jgi:hypothetical protein